ncbi:MAG TPA: hypothetical protein VMW27_00905 [Thermoanaerobaculia bacterium]|nr:hypothetical protein [Thermoanaerobaculia bacterium]
MPRLRRTATLVLASCLALSLVSCSGDDDSPTAPSSRGILTGTWTGSMSVNRSGAAATTTCNLRLTLAPLDDNVLVGSWQADCPDGTSGRESIAAISLFAAVSLNAAGVSPVLDGCAWGSVSEVLTNRITGSWTRATNSCAGSPIQGGTINLRKV